MLRKFSGFLVFLLVICFVQVSFAQTLDILINDMWNYYEVFFKLQNDTEREDLVKQMEFTADKIWEYYRNHQNPDDNESRLVAQAFLLLAMVEYEMKNPTLTYHALQKVNSTNPGVIEGTDPNTNAPFKDKVNGIDSLWLPKFKKCEARVYGFSERNIIWDTLNVEIGITYLERVLREEKIYQAIEWAEDYLNSELRNGKKEIMLLLPPGNYRLNPPGNDRLKTERLDIYPTRFEVEENSPLTVFDVTPDRYFDLRVFLCKDTVTWTDTVIYTDSVATEVLPPSDTIYEYLPERNNYVISRVDTLCDTVSIPRVKIHRIPLSPKDIDVWKGDRKVLNFDHLAFGEYEFAIYDSLTIPSEYWFKRFLPEGLDWDMPKDERLVAEEIFVGPGDPYNYCIDLPSKRIKPPLPTKVIYIEKEKKPEWWEKVIFVVAMGGTFYLFMQTVK